MKTEDLIRTLADRVQPAVSIERSLTEATTVGGALSAIVWLLSSHFRTDLAAAFHSPLFLLKISLAISLAAAAAVLLAQVARPLVRIRRLWVLAVPAVLLAAGLIYELATTQVVAWPVRLLGRNFLHCLAMISLLSLAPAAALLLALQRGAPLRPALAGAAAGLLAGGLGAALYALSCTNDSPLFVATWYSLAIGIVTAACACIGGRTLRW